MAIEMAPLGGLDPEYVGWNTTVARRLAPEWAPVLALARTFPTQRLLEWRDRGALDRKFQPKAPRNAAVAFRIGPEWISICLNDFTRPYWCGNYTIAPEKCGIGPESSDSMWRSWVRGGHTR